ncbi:ABC transporter substrate-binding protein [Nocardioides gilvus]|uniref:ABC transporter substrate-binding protein n=1 Tax=Nocardioides gilvus TaxID=1735589 RepID=UPI0013A537F1|nr:ABC transporter substrate-binding protein [Nocardioides gilvus]
MRTRVIRRVAGVASLAIAATTLAACGSGGESSDTSSDGVLRLAWSSTPTQLDPNVYTGLTWVQAVDGFMEGLVDYDTSKASGDSVLSTEALKPALAESWEVNDEGTQYTFKLREGVKSEYGNEFDADDVMWSFERMYSDPAALSSGVLFKSANVDPEEPVTKIDQYTVRLNLTAPSAIALSVMAYPIDGILDSDEVKKNATDKDPWGSEWLASNSASFGPYKLKTLNSGQEIRLEHNENYWGEKPEFTEIVVKAVPDASARAQLLMSGDVDAISEPPIDQLKTIDDSADAEVSRQPDVNRHNLSFNLGDKDLADPKVRRAISHAIDRDAIVDAVYQGYASPARTPQPSGLITDQPETGEYDPDLAKKLLAEAGHSNGLKIDLSFNTARPGPYAENLARLVQSDLKAVGVDANVKGVASAADFEAAVNDRSMQSYLYTERASQPDGGFALFLYLHSASGLNKSGYDDPEFDKIVGDILVLPGGAEREALVDEALEIVADNEPIISLVEFPDLVGINSSIEGYVALPTGGMKFDELKRG